MESKAVTPRHAHLARQVGHAARTAKLLADAFPSPELETRKLMGRLADFVAAAVNSLPLALGSRMDIMVAQGRLRKLRQHRALADLSNVLLATHDTDEAAKRHPHRFGHACTRR